MDKDFFRENCIGLLILAGGESKRMGTDKSGLLLHGETMTESIAARVKKELFAERLFSAKKGAYLKEFVTIEDLPEVRGYGPGAGIVSGLTVCRSRWLLTFPCDAPLVDAEVAMILAEAAVSSEGEVPIVGTGSRGLEPLIGVYPKKVCPVIESELLRGNLKITKILEKCGFETVKLPEEKIININTPEDYERIKRGQHGE